MKTQPLATSNKLRVFNKLLKDCRLTRSFWSKEQNLAPLQVAASAGWATFRDGSYILVDAEALILHINKLEQLA